MLMLLVDEILKGEVDGDIEKVSLLLLVFVICNVLIKVLDDVFFDMVNVWDEVINGVEFFIYLWS